MPAMPHRARWVCQSGPWRAFAGRVVLPWALQGRALQGDVLEIGCGSGAMAASMLRANPAIRLTATDFDGAMVDVARARLGRFGDRVVVRQADATALPFEDSSFDCVVTFLMLHHVIKWETALAEVARVLRPGGTLLGYDLIGEGTGRVVNGHHHDTRRMQLPELREQFDRLPYVDAETKRSRFGRTVRFAASRAAG
jgi:ubiquinone/menaquinone biosynthesis C-methylase UbiE